MYRYELKLITDERNTINILNWLFKNSSIKKKYNNRFVNSIYFDTPKYKFAKENIIGLSKRKKIRIRWYGRSNNDFHSPVLEIKNKIGRLGEKVNISIKNKIIFNQNIKYNDLTKLLYNNFDILTKINFYPNLHPTLKVNYIREYYETTNNIRVTVDRNINFYKTESNFKIFRNDNYKYYKNIIEFKFNEDLRDIFQKKIGNTNVNFNRSSKYLLGLSKTNGISYI